MLTERDMWPNSGVLEVKWSRRKEKDIHENEKESRQIMGNMQSGRSPRNPSGHVKKRLVHWPEPCWKARSWFGHLYKDSIWPKKPLKGSSRV